MTHQPEPTRRVRWARAQPQQSPGGPQPESGEVERLVMREWLVTNGLGGYASGTVSGVITRRYHGLLIAALPAPIGRTVMLNHLTEEVSVGGASPVALSGEEHVGPVLLYHGAQHFTEFRLELGLPVWVYDVNGVAIEKRIVMPHGQNAVHIIYRLVGGEQPVRVTLTPAVHFRGHEMPVSLPLKEHYVLTTSTNRFEIRGDETLPALNLELHGADHAFTVAGTKLVEILYRIEQSRGYESVGDLWSPGFFTAELTREQPVMLVAAVDEPETLEALRPDVAAEVERSRRKQIIDLAPGARQDLVTAELVLAADQFIITPAARAAEVALAHTAGQDARTIIAGYHWFTDWGRDTMISLEGLTLTTGRHREAGYILRTFAHHVRDGLIPNMFPDGSTEGLYHTADATLWFFHAVDRYIDASRDDGLLHALLPTLRSIVDHHMRGTHYGIRIDPADGMLTQGAEGYQLTWMDAKCDGWVVTPRRGKAVELNALWYNALCVLEKHLRRAHEAQEADRIASHAQRARECFNARFWSEQLGHLYDVVDGPSGNDAACRPNQVLAISLPHPVLAQEHWGSVMDVVAAKLLTPYGLRSLAPDHPDYRSNYHGDLRTRDGAYHQGTVWAWLIGPFVDAWLRLHPDRVHDARQYLKGLVEHLDDFGVGTIAEIFDAEPPFAARGCVAQAWSVAEVLRCWRLTAGDSPAD